MPGEKISAMKVTSVEGGMLDDQGGHMLLKVAVPSGEETVLAFPVSELGALAVTSSQHLTEAMRRSPAGARLKATFDVEWWEVGIDQADGRYVFSFQLEGGGEMSYKLPKDAEQGIVDAIQASKGQGPAGVDPGKAN